MNTIEIDIAERILRRAIPRVAQMIRGANDRPGARPGEPKVGGHPAASTSALHLLGALHFFVRRAEDLLAIKPHAAPLDHVLRHELGLFRRPDGSWMGSDESAAVLGRLRAHPSVRGEPVLQSYHSFGDPDSDRSLPTGSVGLPPVVAAYYAAAENWARCQGHLDRSPGRQWCLIGDAEFREGSLLECLPDVAERGLGSVTWIIDYNRQSLDGPRTIDRKVFGTDDAGRMLRTAVANGWRTIELRHGPFRREVFGRPGGAALRRFFEEELSDWELQALLLLPEAARQRECLAERVPKSRRLLASLSDDELRRLVDDLGGHDLAGIVRALLSCGEGRVPTFVVAHTLKGFGLDCRAAADNHSSLPDPGEIRRRLDQEGLEGEAPYAPHARGTFEREFLDSRGAELRRGLDGLREAAGRRRQATQRSLDARGGLPESFGIDLSLFPRAHSQWMWGQVSAKLTRIASASADALSAEEGLLRLAAERVCTISPDVGTSTNTSFAMDGRIFGPALDDPEESAGIRDHRRPALAPREDKGAGHFRLDICEGNALSLATAIGLLERFDGVLSLPFVTIYDFFVKRALDQLFYGAYVGATFVIVGTPSGVTLSHEGAQHCWKSDFQIAGLSIAEPAFAIEMDWILADHLARWGRIDGDRPPVLLVRAVTRGIDQKQMLARARLQPRFRGRDDEAILQTLRGDLLRGAYRLVDRSEEPGAEPGDNRVVVFAVGSLVIEALEASDRLVEHGILADVVVVCSSDRLLGESEREKGYPHLRENLGCDGALHLRPHPADPKTVDLLCLSGGRIPFVAVVDGEPGLLDDLGSVAGTRQITLGVRRHSKCGRLEEVYRHHGIDADSIVDAARRVLAECAIDPIRIHPESLRELREASRRPAADIEDLLA